MAIEVVRVIPFSIVLLGDGISSTFTIDISTDPIRSVGRVAINNTVPLTVTAEISVDRKSLTFTFSLPFLDVATLSGSFVV